MSWLAAGFAVAAAVALALPSLGMFWAMGLAIFAAALGWLGYQRRETGGWTRLTGAAAVTLAAITLVLSSVKYGMTLAALGRLEGLL